MVESVVDSPLFSGLDPEEARSVLESLVRVQVARGDILAAVGLAT